MAYAKVEEIGKAAPPENYRQAVDRRLERMLKDPESRRLEFYPNRVGSLICGNVNAKNSYGGCPGRQEFIATFTSDGQIDKVTIMPDGIISERWAFEDNVFMLEFLLLDKCGQGATLEGLPSGVHGSQMAVRLMPTISGGAIR